MIPLYRKPAGWGLWVIAIVAFGGLVWNGWMALSIIGPDAIVDMVLLQADWHVWGQAIDTLLAAAYANVSLGIAFALCWAVCSVVSYVVKRLKRRGTEAHIMPSCVIPQ